MLGARTARPHYTQDANCTSSENLICSRFALKADEPSALPALSRRRGSCRSLPAGLELDHGFENPLEIQLRFEADLRIYF